MAQVSSAAWAEFRAMSWREASDALAYLAGREPHTFERLLDMTREIRENGRASEWCASYVKRDEEQTADLHATVAAACRREQDAEADDPREVDDDWADQARYDDTEVPS